MAHCQCNIRKKIPANRSRAESPPGQGPGLDGGCGLTFLEEHAAHHCGPEGSVQVHGPPRLLPSYPHHSSH